jgi:serine protease Do
MGATPIRSTFFAMALTGIAIQTSYAASAVDFSQLVEQVSPAVVRVNVTKKMSDEEILQQQMPELLKRFFGNNIQIPQQRRAPVEQSAYGSAFFISQDGYLLTNHHVIDDARKITITLNDRREVDAELVGSDARTDVAVLKVKGTSYPALKIGDSAALKVGEPVLAIGSPFGFDYSASAGIVSAKARTMSRETAVPFIQSDVALNPGNSGGPLFNQRGDVIGINSRIFSGTGGYMGLSFSIPMDVAMDVFEQIKKNGKVSRAYLGVVPQDIDRNLAEVYNLPKPEGTLLTQVTPDSPAGKAGLQEGDIILSYDNQPIIRATDLINLINRTRPNTTVPLVVQRDGKKLSLNATLKAAPDDTPVAENATNPSSDGPVLGLRVRDLTTEERAQLSAAGVFIDAVQPNGLAARSRLSPGDVITKLNNQATPNVTAFAEALKKLPTNKVVGVSILRGGMPIILGLRIEKE